MTASPLYRDTFALCGVLLEELEGEARCSPLKQRLEEVALRLLEDVALALAGFERLDRVREADAELCALRTHLNLAFELELLDEQAFLDLAGQADAVGRQVGGWLKALRRDGVD